jgi:ABC-type branched-subunit amino acid transport system ATPase component
MTATLPAIDVAAIGAALRAGTQTPAQAAAVELLLKLPADTLTRYDIVSNYLHIERHPHDQRIVDVSVMWSSLHVHAAAKRARLTVSERRLVLLACSLAIPSALISLNDVLTGLTVPDAASLRVALTHLVRGHR